MRLFESVEHLFDYPAMNGKNLSLPSDQLDNGAKFILRHFWKEVCDRLLERSLRQRLMGIVMLHRDQFRSQVAGIGPPKTITVKYLNNHLIFRHKN